MFTVIKIVPFSHAACGYKQDEKNNICKYVSILIADPTSPSVILILTSIMQLLENTFRCLFGRNSKGYYVTTTYLPQKRFL